MPSQQSNSSGRATSQAGTNRGSGSEQAGASGNGSSAGAGRLLGCVWGRAAGLHLPGRGHAERACAGERGRGTTHGLPVAYGGLAWPTPGPSAPAAAGQLRVSRGSFEADASEQRFGREGADTTPSRGGASPGVTGQDTGGWSTPGSRQGEAGAKGSGCASGGSGGGGAGGQGSSGSERGADGGGPRASGGTRAEELRGQIERLQGQLKRLVGEREELRASNARLSSLAEAQAAEIADLRARLDAGSGCRGAPPSSDPWATPGAPLQGGASQRATRTHPGLPRGLAVQWVGRLWVLEVSPFRSSQGTGEWAGQATPFTPSPLGWGAQSPWGMGTGSPHSPRCNLTGADLCCASKQQQPARRVGSLLVRTLKANGLSAELVPVHSWRTMYR